METIVIQDNNPNLIPVIFLIICVTILIVQLIGIKIKIDRRNRLIETRKKIVNRHELIMEENWRRERVKNAKDDNNANTNSNVRSANRLR